MDKLNHEYFFQQWKAGRPIDELAKECSRTAKTIYKAICEKRRQYILDLDVRYHTRPAYSRLAACKIRESAFLQRMPVPNVSERHQSKSTKPYFASLSWFPVLSAEEEYQIFDCYNYMKYRLANLQKELRYGGLRILYLAESCYDRVTQIRNILIETNLRLVVSIAKRKSTSDSHLDRLVSDCNITLMRAIDLFDHRLGIKFSTYATVAISRSMLRVLKKTVPIEAVFSLDEAATTDPIEPTEPGRFREMYRFLAELNLRDQDVIQRRFGLNGYSSMTLEEVATVYSISRERIRQIEKKALGELRYRMDITNPTHSTH